MANFNYAMKREAVDILNEQLFYKLYQKHTEIAQAWCFLFEIAKKSLSESKLSNSIVQSFLK